MWGLEKDSNASNTEKYNVLVLILQFKEYSHENSKDRVILKSCSSFSFSFLKFFPLIL